MAEEKNGKKGAADMGKCMSCGGSSWGACGHWNGWHFILRLVLGIIIVVFVFYGGFKLGLIIGASDGGYGYGMHGYRTMMRGGFDSGYYPGGMMGGWYYPTATSTR